jgi:tetratricopeptide (TPR) repeat protein
MKFCPECGNKLDTLRKFCPECGCKLQGGSGPSSDKSKGSAPSITVGDANVRTFQDANIQMGGGGDGKTDGSSGEGKSGLNINVGDANVRTFEGAQITGTQIGTNIENVNIQGATADEIRKVIAEELARLNLPKTVAKDTKMDLTSAEEKKVKAIAVYVEEAEEHFGELVGDANSYVELGNVELLKGNVRKAMEMYDKALRIDDSNVDAWNNKGYLLTNLGRTEEGLKCCEKATELDPGRGMAWNNLGFAQYRLGKIPDARKSFEKAVEIEPELALAWYNLGILVGNQGGIDEAIFYFDTALKLEPNFSAAKQSKEVCEHYKEYTDGFDGFDDLDSWGFDGVEEDDVNSNGMDTMKVQMPEMAQATRANPTYQTQGPYQATQTYTQQQTAGYLTCPRCRSKLTYYPQYRRYYCHNCRMYI